MTPSAARSVFAGALAAWLFLVPLGVAGGVLAQGPGDDPADPILPPLPDERPSFLSAEFHVTTIVPISRESLCPSGADCVFNGGFGLGGSGEKRWASGLTLGVSYDAWFVDSEAIYEIGVMQSLKALGRFIFSDGSVLHPFVGAAAGVLVFGDTFRISTAGLGFELSIGAEVEITETFWVQIAVPWRVFSTLEFETGADGVARSVSGGNTAMALQAGFVILEAP